MPRLRRTVAQTVQRRRRRVQGFGLLPHRQPREQPVDVLDLRFGLVGIGRFVGLGEGRHVGIELTGIEFIRIEFIDVLVVGVLVVGVLTLWITFCADSRSVLPCADGTYP